MGNPQAIEVRVLGALEVRRADRPVAIAGAKPREILTLLGLNAGRVVSADVIEEVLWGDHPPRTAHKALQTHISAVRRALGVGTLVTHGAGWRLATGTTTDAAAFEAVVAAARRAVERGEAEVAVSHYARAVELWRGPPELPLTHRGIGELTRWTEQYESVIDERTDALLESGHSSDLVGELEAAVSRTPLRERRWAQLCVALYRCGRQGDALEAYQRARYVLGNQLGVDPGPHLRAIEAAVLAHDPSLNARATGLLTAFSQAKSRAQQGERSSTSSARTVAARLAGLPSPRSAFVGRTVELAQLQDLLAEHSLVSVTGPGGVGKTRLAVAVAESAASRFPGGVKFVDLVPATAALVAQAVAVALGVADRTDRPVEDVIIDRLTGEPSLLLLDNCEHVIDAAGDLAARLIERSDVTILATSRERLGVRDERVLLLPPLSLAPSVADPEQGSEAAALFVDRVRASGGELDADPDVIGQVCARLDGIPLAIELAAARCASLGIDGLLAGLDDRLGLLSGGRGVSERHRSVRAVLDWSHDLLDDAERTLFRRVSVFVGGFDLSAAAAVNHGAAGVSGVIDVIGRLTDKSLLVHERGPAGSRWRMLEVVRSYAREHLAANGDEPDVLAEHLRWAAVAAADLERKLDSGRPWRDVFDAVADDLRVALFGPARDPRGSRPDLALALARLQARRGRFAAAQAAYEAAVSLAKSAGDAGQLARAALGASLSGMLFGVTQAGRVALLEEALAAQPEEPTSERARLQARLATELFWSPQRERGLALAGEAVETAEKLIDDAGTLAHALHARHYVTRGPGGLEEGLGLAAQIIELAHRSGETQLELAGRAAYVVGLLNEGDLARMDAELAALAEGADRLDHPEFQWYAQVYRLVRALIDGRFNDADQLLEQAGEAANQAPEFSIGLFFAEAITDLRRLSGAARDSRLAQLAEMARRFRGVLVWRCLTLATSVEAPTPPEAALVEARALTSELLEQHRDGHWLVGCCLLAEAVTALGESELAARLDRALRPYAGRLAVAGRVAGFRGSVSHALGLLAQVQSHPSQAVADFEQAVAQHDRMAALPFQERSLRALAGALEARGGGDDAERASAVRAQADDLATRLGAGWQRS